MVNGLPGNNSHFYEMRSHSRLKIIIKTAITTKAIPAYNQLPVRRSTTMAMRVAGRKVIRLPTMNMIIISPMTTSTTNTSNDNMLISMIISPLPYTDPKSILRHH
jgi:hypothetical protein